MTLPKIIFHDIDGCLNPPNGEDFGPGDAGGLSENQLSYLGKLREVLEVKGVDLVLNTGRNLEDSKAMVDSLSGPRCRYGLFEHGAYGWDFETDQEINLHQLALDQGDNERASKYDDMAIIPKLIRWYSDEGRHLLSKRLGLEPPPLRKRSNLSLECIGGLKAPDLMAILKEVVDEGFEDKGNRPLVYCHSAYFVDVLGTVHKSDGAKILLEHLGMREDEALIVGDGMNDMDMFESWPRLLCPSNAFEGLKALCRERNGDVSTFPYIEATITSLNAF